jgi:hypothetical protein
MRALCGYKHFRVFLETTMINKILLISIIVLLSACSVSGKYRGDGPCEGFHKDPEACERAAANSLVISNIQLGQSPEEVREIMGNEPERREVTDSLETWGYRTNYAERLFTTITFKDGKVSSIKQHSN